MQEDKVCVKLLFFAKAREVMGKHEMDVLFSPGPYDSKTLRHKVLNSCKDLMPIAESFILALNEEYTDNMTEFSLKDKDEIAVIPPLSGG
ncbi:hypothetical protein JTE90_020041 [Oedothorax gibbosus]|uniref:Molybdopterin synthase sulfur carrier subunit n=1 Tax=Oedothorax gibbosus TaxID=931172 RepID=A0AAV6UUG8_9ARAC|nr:hypothetical protein JTE90_020041 [Oedothorax gibbosus]